MYSSDRDRREAYLAGLEWKHGVLQAELAVVRAEAERLTKEEAQILNRLRALETLLMLEVGAVATNAALESLDKDGSLEQSTTLAAFEARQPGVPGSSAEILITETRPNGTGVLSSKTRLIYQSVRRVLIEAGVPMHYRQIAEEVQKSVPLNGADPAATLIAHLSRARDLFPRVGRGHYWLADTPLPTGASGSFIPTKHAGQQVRVRRARRSR
jgi:hypothetical protein